MFAATDKGFILKVQFQHVQTVLDRSCTFMFLYVSFAAVLLELVHLRSSDVAHYLPLDHTFGVCVGVPLRQ